MDEGEVAKREALLARQGELRQHGLQILDAAGLARRQEQLLSKPVRSFVDGHPWPVRRKFHEDAGGIANIK